MFETKRVYRDSSKTNGKISWFADTREGQLGPFETEKEAELAYQRHISHCKTEGLDGGRKLGLQNAGSLFTLKEDD